MTLPRLKRVGFWLPRGVPARLSSPRSDRLSTRKHGLSDRGNVDRGVHIPVMPGTAFGTIPVSNVERKRGEDVAAARTPLAPRIPAINGDERPSIPCRLVVEVPHQFPPSRVADVLGKRVVPHHVLHPQTFAADRLVLTYQPRRQFVGEVPPSITNPCFHAGKMHPRLLSAFAPFLLARQRLLRLALSLRITVAMARIADLLPGRKGDERGDAEINPHDGIRQRERVNIVRDEQGSSEICVKQFCRHNSASHGETASRARRTVQSSRKSGFSCHCVMEPVPPITQISEEPEQRDEVTARAIPTDGHRGWLRTVRQRARPANLQGRIHLREGQCAIRKPEAAHGVFRRLLAVLALERRIRGATSKEVAKGGIEMPQGLLCRHAGNLVQPDRFRLPLQRGETCRAFLVGDAFLSLVVGVGAHPECPVVDVARRAERLCQYRPLSGVWVATIAVGAHLFPALARLSPIRRRSKASR